MKDGDDHSIYMQVKKIKNELEKQKKSLESLVNIQKGFQKLNKQKAKVKPVHPITSCRLTSVSRI